MMKYILVMQRFLVIYRGISLKSVTCVFCYTHEPLYQETTRDEWDIPLYTTREGYTTILYHAIESTVAG